MVLSSDSGIKVFCQLDDGFNISHIEGTKRPFHRRSVPDGVADGLHIMAAQGTLYQALQMLPAWSSATLPGYHEFTGLHAGLSGLKSNLTPMETSADQGTAVTVGYQIRTGITGNIFSQAIDATRMVMLYEEDLAEGQSCVVIGRDDQFAMVRECHFGHLEHPNLPIQPGDRICANLGKLNCLFDRDGVTPDGLNPFIGFKPDILREFYPERCFFLHIAPVEPTGGGDPVVPMLLLGEDGTGLGFTSAPSPNFPSWVMVWFSPMSNTDGEGVGSIEFGTLPLGPKRAIELGLMPKFPAGTKVRRRTNIYLLDTPALTNAFAQRYRIATNPGEYCENIGTDWEDPAVYDQERCTFDSLRHAAGVK